MGYTINIAKADQNKDGSFKLGSDKKPSYAHYFATSTRSIGYASIKAKRIVEELLTIYPSPLFKIEVSMDEKISRKVDIDTL